MQDVDLESAVAHPLAKYRNHLEFNGYRIEDEGEDWLFSRHPRKVNLSLKKIGERGVLVSTLYGVKENVERTSLLEFNNTLNAELLFMKVYLDSEGLLRIETFFEGDYDRTNFSILLENIDFDMNMFFEHDLTRAYLQ
jgi:hypothetical protein